MRKALVSVFKKHPYNSIVGDNQTILPIENKMKANGRQFAKTKGAGETKYGNLRGLGRPSRGRGIDNGQYKQTSNDSYKRRRHESDEESNIGMDHDF